MLKEANVFSKAFTKKDFDLILSKIKKMNCLDFETFLDVVPNLAIVKYHRLSPSKAFGVFLDNHFNVSFEKIISSTSFGLGISLCNLKVDSLSFEVFNLLGKSLFSIYEVCFLSF